MEFRTIIPIKKQQSINSQTRFVLLGSCFAEHIGQKLLDFRFQGDVNPFGVLYNPISIAQSVERLLAKQPFEHKELFEYNNLWHSWMHHGSFSDAEADVALGKMNARYTQACDHLEQADVLIITFGSSWVYEYEGHVVANCHKVPNNQFIRRRLSVNEIVERYTALCQQLWARNPQLQIILSVSPIRYMNNDATENQTNKAILLLAVEELCRKFSQISYFPAYEIVLDELRDYRFFADDMIHPAPVAIAYVWQRFAQAYFTDDTLALLPQIEKENKQAAHRPLH